LLGSGPSNRVTQDVSGEVVNFLLLGGCWRFARGDQVLQ
jgi:hypothetical protein